MCRLNFIMDLIQEGIMTIISLQEKHLDVSVGVEAYLWLSTPQMVTHLHL